MENRSNTCNKGEIMKRLIVLFLLLFASNVYAGNPVSKSIALNTSTFTAITIEQVAVGRDIGCVTSDSTAWIFSEDEAGTIPITVPAPGTISFECRKSVNGVAFYAKATVGTPNLSVFVGPCRNN